MSSLFILILTLFYIYSHKRDNLCSFEAIRRLLILMKIDKFDISKIDDFESSLTPLSWSDTDLKLLVYSKLGTQITVKEKKIWARLKVWAQECAKIFILFPILGNFKAF